MSANGRLTASELSTAQTGVQLAKKTAVRWALLKADVKKSLGRTIAIAAPGGGYRSWAVQDEMHRASLGNKTLALKWKLNPNSSVPLAAPGASSHGTGTRVDVVGTAMDTAFLALARKYGFVLEFPGRDPNHFIDLGTYKVTLVSTVKSTVSAKKVYVKVLSGQTLTKIAKSYKLSLPQLLALNPAISNPDKIKVGQKVRVA